MRTRAGSIGILVALALAGSAAAAAADAWKPELTTLRITSTSPGGTWHTYGQKLAAALEKVLPGVAITNSPGGSLLNPQILDRNEAQIAFQFAPTAAEAWLGTGSYKTKLQNGRMLGIMVSAPIHIVVRGDSKITKISDLTTSRLSVGKRTWDSTRIMLETLDALGITPEKMKAAGGVVHWLGFPEDETMMQDRNLDAFMYFGSIPSPLLFRLSQEGPGIRVLPFTDGDVQKILARLTPKGAFFPQRFPKHPYKGVPGDFPSVGFTQVITVHKDLSNEMVYRIARVVYESPELIEFLGLKDTFRLADMFTGVMEGVVPPHPGAVRYFLEKEVITKAAHDAYLAKYRR